MRYNLLILQSLIMVSSYMGLMHSNKSYTRIIEEFTKITHYFCLVLAREPTLSQEMKAEAGMITTMSPPEGNSTFLGGTTWCVAHPGAPQADLQRALDWACGEGRAGCGPIQKGGPCFEPDTILSHASYAFNSYYQQNGNNEIACNFGVTAIVTQKDPSYGNCVYAASRDVKSSGPPLMKNKSSMLWWQIIAILLLFNIKCQ